MCTSRTSKPARSRLRPPGPGSTPDEARSAVADLRALARYAVGPVRERTGLDAGDAPEAVIVERDRRRAIERALSAASSGDIVLIAGKGHEPYQEIAGRTLPFDDRVVAEQCLLRRAA